MRKKILVLASTFPRWKNDTTPPFVFELEKRLVKDFEIHVLAPHYKSVKREEMMEGLHIHRFRYFWPASLQKLCYEGGILPNLKRNKLLYIQAVTLIIFELITAIKIVRKEKIDLIHAHWIIPQGIVALIIKKIFNIQYLVTSHGGDIFGVNNKISFLLKKAILENAKTTTVVSNAIKQKIDKINKKINPIVIPMGVDSKLFNPNKYDALLKARYNSNGKILLFVGRLEEKKGVEYLIKAMPAIIKKAPKVKLLIIGSGTLENELKKLSFRLKLNKHVIFIGALSNKELPRYYAIADIFIGPSVKTRGGDAEGFGLTFVEAIFSGTPVIGTSAGGIPDIISKIEIGRIVKQKNPNAIVNEIIKLLSKRKNPKIKTNKMKDLIKFDWDNISLEYIKLINPI